MLARAMERMRPSAGCLASFRTCHNGACVTRASGAGTHAHRHHVPTRVWRRSRAGALSTARCLSSGPLRCVCRATCMIARPHAARGMLHAAYSQHTLASGPRPFGSCLHITKSAAATFMPCSWKGLQTASDFGA